MKINRFIIIILIIFSISSLTISAEQEAQLEIYIFGGFPFPGLLKSTGGVITNIGDITAHNITYNISIIGGMAGSINLYSEGDYSYLKPVAIGGEALGVIVPNVYGFGIVTITITTSANNAEKITKTAKGFQLGDITWIPMSWISLLYPFVNQ